MSTDAAALAPTPAAAEAPAPEHVPGRRACLFSLGGAVFAVDIRDAREVVVIDALARVPAAPPVVLGVMNLRGEILPVVEARPLLGLTPRPVGPGTRAIVFADGELRAAVAIEGVVGLEAFDEAQPLPSDVTLLDVAHILSTLRNAWSAHAPLPRGGA